MGRVRLPVDAARLHASLHLFTGLPDPSLHFLARLANRLAETVSTYRYRDSIHHALASWVERFPGARLVETQFEPSNEGTWVVAVVRTPEPIAPEQIARIEPRLPKSEGGRTLLRVRSVLTQESTARGAFQPPPGDGGFPSERSEDSFGP